MIPFWLKVLITSVVVAGISELGKRFTLAGAILASLPLTSILGMVWLYQETRDPARNDALSIGIFWAVLPSLLFFVVLPFCLRAGMRFPAALGISCVAMALGYTVYVYCMHRLGVAI